MIINNCFRLFFCLCIGILPPLSILAQTKPPKPVVNVAPTAYLRLVSGEEFVAKILSKDSTSIQVLVVKTDELRRIEVENLVDIRPVNTATSLEKDYDFSSRHAFSNTALSLKKGESFYQNSMLGYNSYYYGLTDRWTVGGGLILFSLIEDPILPAWGQIKYSYPISRYFHVGLNFLGLKAFELDGGGFDNVSFLAAWGNLTVGDRDNNLTVGWGRQGDDFDGFFSQNMTQASGQLRLGKRWSLLAGFWQFKPREINPSFISFFPQDTRTHLYSGGFRYTVGRSAWELSVLHCPPERSFNLGDFTIPVATYVRRW